MTNTRILFNNAADRATLTASTTAGALAVDSLKTDVKGEVWRATGTSAALTARLPSAETISCLVLPLTNMTVDGTVRVRVSADGVDLSDTAAYILDTGAVRAVVAAPDPVLGWGNTVQGANTFAYGGGACAVVWIPGAPSGAGVRVDLADPGNPAGYVEASRLAFGAYWELAINPDTGLALSIDDTDMQTRNGAGDLTTLVGTRHRRLALKLSSLSASERAKLWSVMRANGKAISLFVSVFPGCGDASLEASHQMWCRLTDTSSVAATAFTQYAAPLTFAEV